MTARIIYTVCKGMQIFTDLEKISLPVVRTQWTTYQDEIGIFLRPTGYYPYDRVEEQVMRTTNGSIYIDGIEYSMGTSRYIVRILVDEEGQVVGIDIMPSIERSLVDMMSDMGV